MLILNDEYSNSKIYRVYSMPIFLRTLKYKKLAFSEPKLWDDPYENFFKKYLDVDDDTYVERRLKELSHYEKLRNIKLTKGNPIEESIEKIFGQCWTLKEETDALWKIYAPNNDGVKVKTIPNKIKEVYEVNIKKDKSEFEYSYVQGKVQYYQQKDYDNYIKETMRRNLTGEISDPNFFSQINYFFGDCKRFATMIR